VLLLLHGQVMLTFSHSHILRYRLVCLILAVGYFLYQFTETNYNNFGIQFRYLTIWGLTTAMVATWLLYKSKHKGLPESYLPFVSATAVLNAMVVFLYWKLYFIDPSLVNYSGSIVWFQEYYLHILGPALIILDALLLNNSFTQVKKGVMTILAICLLYILWSEVLTGPLNDTPEGAVTSGLPYPFLNNMSFSERMSFYATTIATGLGFYVASWIFAKLKSKFLE
jgi:hypothetical protein